MTLSEILISILGGVVLAYLPGAAIFRLPIADRKKRAALAAEERVFWQIVISIVWTLGAVMVMAAAAAYRFERLLMLNIGLTVLLLLIGRGSLLWRGTQAKVTIAVLVPLTLLGLGVWRFFPAAEYIIGGKDPGVYVNEGFAIARSGKLFRRDEVVTKVAEADRDLFFRSHRSNMYYSNRFMGVTLNNPNTGDVISGWPQLYPASIAIGYSLGGALGATNIVSLWAVLGLLAVYFFGSRLIGRLPAAFAVGVLALNVIESWFGKYPNAEVAMQALLFSALLAMARAHQDGDRFFGWVAGALFVALMFLRLDSMLPITIACGALGLRYIVENERPRLSMALLIAAGSYLAVQYYQAPMLWYSWQYREHLPSESVTLLLVAAAFIAVVAIGRMRSFLTGWLKPGLPIACAVALIGLAIYALFFREAGGRLRDYDAYALRTYRDVYVFWPALVAALAGYAMEARRTFWRDPAFFLTAAAYAVFFFNKIHVMPEQWWMARRFLPMILPAMLLFASAAVFGSSTPEHRRTVRRAVAAILFMGFIGWQYFVSARTVAKHVEYKGAIAQVAKLAEQFTARDLIIVESRDAQSDFHVLALPLAYEYGLNVLVLESPRPDRQQFERFLADAQTKFERVLFLGGGGTDLLTRRIIAKPIAFTPLEVPEFETTDWKTVPKAIRPKDLGYSIFQLSLGTNADAGFSIDVGYLDDLNVVRFFAREVSEGRSIRWSRRRSFVAATGLTGNEREIELVLHDGGRPKSATPATLDVFFNETPLGRINVGFGFQTYRLAIPAEVIRAAAQGVNPASITLVSTTWVPRDFLGGNDDRELGVMVDRIAIH